MNLLKQHLLNPLSSILFPQFCAGCQTLLHPGEELLCLHCCAELPFTGLEQIREHEADMRLYGKCRYERSTALLYFRTEGLVQRLLHQLKYGHRPELGVFLGRLMATRLSRSGWLDTIDVLVPVPLHWRKRWSRGYNQSACIAEGLSAASGIPLVTQAVTRRRHTDTQIHKSRSERLQNMHNAFSLYHPDTLIDRHVLLIDDVLTTGATLMACGNVLTQIPGVRLSMATVALAAT